MVIAVNKRKLLTLVLLNGISLLVFIAIAIAIAIPFVSSADPDKNNYQITLAVIGIILIAIITGLPLFHLIRVRRYFEDFIHFEEGLLCDHTGILNYGKKIYIDQIHSVEYMPTNFGLGKSNQIIVKLKQGIPFKNPLLNQLRGRVIYITDYLVDSGELKELAEELKRRITESSSKI